jgi:hypothetical protein
VATLPRVHRRAAAALVAGISAPTIFHEDWWPEATTGARFREAVAYDTNGAMIGHLPYFRVRKRNGQSAINNHPSRKLQNTYNRPYCTWLIRESIARGIGRILVALDQARVNQSARLGQKMEYVLMSTRRMSTGNRLQRLLPPACRRQSANVAPSW